MLKEELKKEISNEFKVNLTDEDFEVLKGKEMNLNNIKEALDDGNIYFDKNMKEIILWQNDDYESSSQVLEKLLNLEINREFLEKYIEAGCKSLADFVSAYLMDDSYKRVKLKDSVAYIY